MLRGVLEELPAARRDIPRPLVPAVAVLGVAVSYDQAVPRPDDEVDTAAHLLALVLCDSDRDRLSAGVKRVLVGATTRETRRTATEAERRIGAGLLVSVVG